MRVFDLPIEVLRKVSLLSNVMGLRQTCFSTLTPKRDCYLRDKSLLHLVFKSQVNRRVGKCFVKGDSNKQSRKPLFRANVWDTLVGFTFVHICSHFVVRFVTIVLVNCLSVTRRLSQFFNGFLRCSDVFSSYFDGSIA